MGMQSPVAIEMTLKTPNDPSYTFSVAVACMHEMLKDFQSFCMLTMAWVILCDCLKSILTNEAYIVKSAEHCSTDYKL